MPLEVPDRNEWFPKIEAFPRPDWPAIRGWKRAWIGKDEQEEATQQIIRYWLERVRAALGGTYSIVESDHFHFLSTLEEKGRTRMLQFLESSRDRLRHTLGDAAWSDTMGKHVILRFTEIDDYYAYIAHFYSEGEHATSAGIFLRGGYCHIAYYEQLQMDSERMTLAHELAHNLVANLPLPLWFNEALAEAFEADLVGRRFAAVPRDLHAEHEAFWNAETIQEFWRGKSFHTVKGQRVSYSLAQVLLDIINREVRPPGDVFRRFVKQSTWQDAGEAAAQEQLEVGLGEIASVFLGEGDWSPRPETWESGKRQV